MTAKMNQIAAESIQHHLDFKFRFNYESHSTTTDMISAIRDRYAIGVNRFESKNLLAVQWIAFAAFHEYSRAPFVFIDMTNVSKEITMMVCEIIKRILRSSQLFVNSSHVHHIGFAKLQYCIIKQVNVAVIFRPRKKMFYRIFGAFRCKRMVLAMANPTQ